MLLGLGAALIPDWLPHLQKFPLWVNQPLGIHGKKTLSNYACVFGESIQSRNTRSNLQWLTPLLKKYTPEGLNCSWYETKQYQSTSIVIYAINSSKAPPTSADSTSLTAQKRVLWTTQKADVHTGQYSGGFTLRLSLPLKTKQFRKHAANTRLATQSHRKCTNCLKTIEAELGGFTVTQQSRTTQEASNCLKRQHTTGDHDHRSIDGAG